MTPHFTQNEIEFITSIAIKAGKIAADYFTNKNFEIWKKTERSRTSKVTSADIAVSEFLNKNLSEKFPSIPIICEEKNSGEVDAETFFLIDPIDGTSSFIDNNVEFAIIIALVKNRKAVFGLIYAPLFEGGKMAFSDHNNNVILDRKAIEDLERLGSETKLMRSSIALRSRMTGVNEGMTGVAEGEMDMAERKTRSAESLRIVTSTRTKESDIKNYIAKAYPNFQNNFSVERLSSAIKFFRLLENNADIYLHFRESSEWDIAAGQALIELMGGKVKSLIFTEKSFEIGDDLTYRKPDFINQPFISFITNPKTNG